MKAFRSQHYFEVEVEKLEILSHNELLQHPNFVKIFGCCSLRSLFGIVMEMSECLRTYGPQKIRVPLLQIEDCAWLVSYKLQN